MTVRRAVISSILLALVAGVIFVLVWIARLPLQPEYRTQVMITSIAYSGSKYRPALAAIRFRSKGGLEGEISTPPANLTCKVGDKVPAIQQGTTIDLAPGACEKIVLP